MHARYALRSPRAHPPLPEGCATDRSPSPARSAQFKYYLYIELGVWLPATFVLCWRWQPTIRFVATPFGARFVARAGEVLERYLPSYHESISRLTGRMYGSPTGRTVGEWLLLNKVSRSLSKAPCARRLPRPPSTLPAPAWTRQVLSPVSFPAKIYIAHRIVKARERSALVAELPSFAGASAGGKGNGGAGGAPS